MDFDGGASAYLEPNAASEGESSDGEASPRGAAAGAGVAGTAATGLASAASSAAGALRGWRAWGGGALSALSGLQLDSVQRLATEALATVKRDVGEFSQALTADAVDLAAAGAGAVEEALPELRATAAGLQEKLEVVGGGIETAGASLLANIAQARPSTPPRSAAQRSDTVQRPQRRSGCVAQSLQGFFLQRTL